MRRLLLLTALAVVAGAAAQSAVALPPLVTHGPDGDLRSRGAIAASAASSVLPRDWCGPERYTDDSEHELPNGTYRYHAVYAIAADGQDRLADTASQIQSQMVGASALLEELYARAIRFDMGTACGGQYVDITTLRLPQTTAELARLADTGDTYDTVLQDLTAAGMPTVQAGETPALAGSRTTNWVVFLDAPGPAGGCGQGTSFRDTSRAPDNANNSGGQVALLFKPWGSFCGANAVRHEIGHTLGALQQVAPHAFDGFHCDDSADDAMCVEPGQPSGGRWFDYGNDDYWDPPGGKPLGWWTADLSRFLCTDPLCNVPPELRSQAWLPAPAIPDAPANEPSLAVDLTDASVPYVRITVQGRPRGWRYHARASGRGRALVAIRCPGRRRAIAARRVALPARMRGTTRCRRARVATIRSIAS